MIYFISVVSTPFRTLYANNVIGVDGYVQFREKTKANFQGAEEKFKRRMQEFIEKESTEQNLVFTEDIKNMIHIVENTPEEVELVVKMIKKFNTQNKLISFGNYNFGPTVMRMFHHFKLAEIALKVSSFY